MDFILLKPWITHPNWQELKLKWGEVMGHSTLEAEGFLLFNYTFTDRKNAMNDKQTELFPLQINTQMCSSSHLLPHIFSHVPCVYTCTRTNIRQSYIVTTIFL